MTRCLFFTRHTLCSYTTMLCCTRQHGISARSLFNSSCGYFSVGMLKLHTDDKSCSRLSMNNQQTVDTVLCIDGLVARSTYLHGAMDKMADTLVKRASCFWLYFEIVFCSVLLLLFVFVFSMRRLTHALHLLYIVMHVRKTTTKTKLQKKKPLSTGWISDAGQDLLNG